MPNFATYADLEHRLGITLTAAEQTRATALLTDASDLVRQAARQEISEVSGDVLTRRGIHKDRLRLPQRPVQSVASVTYETLGFAAPETLDSDEYYLDGDELVRYRGWGSPPGWFGPDFELVITYDHGYADADIPKLVKQITLEAVARVWVNPGSVVREAFGPETTDYGPTKGMMLLEHEEEQLHAEFGPKRYRSVDLG